MMNRIRRCRGRLCCRIHSRLSRRRLQFVVGRRGDFVAPRFQDALFERVGQRIGPVGQLGRLGCLEHAMVAHDSGAGHAVHLFEVGPEDRLVDSRTRYFGSGVDGQAELGSESSCEPERERAVHRAAGVEGQIGEFRVRAVEVRNARKLVLPQSCHDHGILESGRHGMTRVALGVHHEDVAGVFAEGRPQGLGFCLG